MLDPPIYYSLRMSTAVMRDENTIKECIERFTNKQLELQEQMKKRVQYHLQIAQSSLNEYNVKSVSLDQDENNDKFKEDISTAKEALKTAETNVEQALTYDSTNEETKKLQEIIFTLKQKDLSRVAKEKRETVDDIYRQKINALQKSKKTFTICFIVLSIIYAITLALIFFLDKNPISDLTTYILKKASLSITITILVFWVAQFLNRRIHENVHLLEEYDHKRLLLKGFEFFTNSTNEKDDKKKLEP